MSLFALYDLESRVDKHLLRSCRYPTLPDTDEGAEQAYKFEQATLREKQALAPNEDPFFPLQWHVPIAISVGIVSDSTDDGDAWKLSHLETVLGDEPRTDSREKDIVVDFWARVERFRQRKGILVSFNGRGFDQAVLELHALKHGIATPIHLGEKFGARYRFQTDSHLDLMEFITNYGAVYTAKGGMGFYLQMLGYAGKGAVDGSAVQGLYEAGRMDEIERYNRNDVRRLYQLFLHVSAWRGMLDAQKAGELACAVEMEPETA